MNQSIRQCHTRRFAVLLLAFFAAAPLDKALTHLSLATMPTLAVTLGVGGHRSW